MYNNNSAKVVGAAMLPITGIAISPVITYIGYVLVAIALVSTIVLKFKQKKGFK